MPIAESRSLPGARSIDMTEEAIANFLSGLPPGTDAALVAIILIREGLNYFVQTRGRGVAVNTAERVLKYLCPEEPAT